MREETESTEAELGEAAEDELAEEELVKEEVAEEEAVSTVVELGAAVEEVAELEVTESKVVEEVAVPEALEEVAVSEALEEAVEKVVEEADASERGTICVLADGGWSEFLMTVKPRPTPSSARLSVFLSTEFSSF